MKKKLNRREFIGASGAALMGATLSFGNDAGAEGKSSSRRAPGPNVVLMTADDLGWKDLSCYGNQNLSTPHLDALAAQGVRFTRAFGVSSSCSSSRASFITGEYISTHGVDGLVHRHLGRQLTPFRRTLPGALRKAGYHTAIEGKWHVSLLPTSLYGYEEAIGSSLMWKRHIKDSQKTEKYLSARAADGKPFYLELNFTGTHRNAKGIFEGDPQFRASPDAIRAPEWTGLPNWPEIRAELALYYEGLLKTDFLVGQAMALLKKYGFEENTIVVFVSDNGSSFPGNKMTLLDRGVGTPLLIRYPRAIASGRTSNALVSTIDIMPTILDLCRVPQGKKMEGSSLANLLRDGTIDHHRQMVFSEMNYHVHHIPMRSVRGDRWKLIENLSDSPVGIDDVEKVEWALRLCEEPGQPWLRKRVPFELYDLSNDPNETQNLAGRAEVARVEAMLRQELARFASR